MPWLLKRGLVHALSVVFLALLSATGSAAAESRTVTDALKREVAIHSTTRLVTLGADVSEIVTELGLQDRIVGVDRGSTFPEALKALPNLGYRRSLSAEGLVTLAPDLILASEDVATPDALARLNELGYPVVFVPIDNSLEGLQRKIGFIAGVLERRDEGAALERRVLADFADAAALVKDVPEEKRRKVIFFHGLLRLTAAGRETAADAIIRYAGGVNPITFDGYKPVSEELLLKLAPDTILMMPDNRGGPSREEVFSTSVLASTPAGATQSLFVLQGAYMINFGPRTANAIRALATALYP